jgi:nicotinamide-nucleotide amidase
MQLMPLARQVARTLAERELRVVFAESCTAGLVSAALSRIPGISQWHCGSAVTYRDDTKSQWLAVRAADIARESAVSEPVARQMARGVLTNTPEAHLSASVTGHLGPDAPPDLDGVIYVAIAQRRGSRIQLSCVERLQLTSTTRYQRQREAVAQVFRYLLDAIE